MRPREWAAAQRVAHVCLCMCVRVTEKSEDIESLSQSGASQAKRHKPNEKPPSAEARGGRQTLGVCLSSR